MKIAIDFDGTIFNTENAFRTFAEFYDIEKCRGNGIVNSKENYIQDRYDWNYEEKEEYLSYFPRITKNASIIPGADAVIKKLKQDGNEMYLITTRGNKNEQNNKETLSKNIETAKEKLKENGLIFDKYFFGNPNKGQICKENNVDIMIDDLPYNCENIASYGIKSIFLHENGVRNAKKNINIIEVFNWGEVYRKILELNHKIKNK